MRVVEERPVEMRRRSACARSVAFEPRRALRDERVVRAPEILGRACTSPAPRASASIAASRSIAHSCVQQRFVMRVRERRAVGERARERRAPRRSTASGATDAIVEAPRVRLRRRASCGRCRAARRAALADDARQQRARAHVAAGEADAHEQERDLAPRRAEAQVGSPSRGSRPRRRRCRRPRRRSAAGSARIAFTRSPVIRVNASRPGVSPCCVERADDVVHVAAGAEVAAGAGDDDGLDVARVRERAEQVAQLGVATRRSADSCARAGRA